MVTFAMFNPPYFDSHLSWDELQKEDPSFSFGRPMFSKTCFGGGLRLQPAGPQAPVGKRPALGLGGGGDPELCAQGAVALAIGIGDCEFR